MECPYCQTENREDRETCYACGKDISTVRLVVNKSRQHYNDALEHAERGRITEAIDELKHSIDLDASLVNAHVVLGTLYARQGQFPEARECWKTALALNPEMERAHDYLERVESVQAVLPTLKTYRWAATLLLLATVALAAVLIYAFRPDPGAVALRAANQLIEKQEYGAAVEELEQARVLAEPASPVGIAATALENTIRLGRQQQVRMIQDLKYRQLFPEALEAITALEASGPDMETSAALSIIKSDISYYYHSLIAQLYAGYEQGDLEFEALQAEINSFLTLYPTSPDYEEILGYLERAERLEVQTAMDELRRRFALDNNVETAVEGLRDLGRRYGNLPTFQAERSLFIEEILSYQLNRFTGFLDQEEFASAAALLILIEQVTDEFRAVVDIELSGAVDGAVDLAWSVLRDARRQYQLEQIEELITSEKLEAAEEAVFDMLLEEDLSNAELGVLRSLWRRVNRRELLDEFYRSRPSDRRYFEQQISDDEASKTLGVLDDIEGMRIPRRQRVHLLGLGAASAWRLGEEDRATSLTATLRSLDANSTVTRAVQNMIQKQTEEPPPPKPEPVRERIRVEPVEPGNREE